MSSGDPLTGVESALGYAFRDRSLLRRALTHDSWAHESGEAGIDYERLEFLGDSLLNFLVAEHLCQAFPSLPEGTLSKARSQFVAAASFAAAARRLGLGAALRLAAGEARAGGQEKESLLSDAFEAVVAAVYLDGGMAPARAVARAVLGPGIEALDPASVAARDPKTALQELSQARSDALPEYRLVSESGSPHEKTFVYEVAACGATARGEGPSKKEAQRAAAADLLANLSREPAG